MIRGSCLCGGVRFEVSHFTGPFELCHCNRCRKSSGSGFAAMIGVKSSDFRWVKGKELIESWEAPVLESPPAYLSYFCSVCGSPTPADDADIESDWFEIPAGLLDDDPALRPDRHIYVEHTPAWDAIQDSLPQLGKEQLKLLRNKGNKESE